MISKRINEIISRMEIIKTELVEVPATDYTQYRERVAKYNGLKEALDILLKQDEDD